MSANIENIMTGINADNKQEAEFFIKVCDEVGVETYNHENNFSFGDGLSRRYESLYIDLFGLMGMAGEAREIEVDRIKTRVTTLA